MLRSIGVVKEGSSSSNSSRSAAAVARWLILKGYLLRLMDWVIALSLPTVYVWPF